MAEPDVTHLLNDIQAGKQGAFDALIAHVYPSLREMARARLRNQSNSQTLNTTGLVHDAYIKMVQYQDVNWKGRAHFFGAVAQTMRRILVDHARSKSSQKRKGEQVSLTAASPASEVSLDQLIEIDDALKRLELERPRWVRILECRYFTGLNIQETAEVLGISHGTVSNDWRMARAWLHRELGE